jgi:hypothetical protein
MPKEEKDMPMMAEIMMGIKRTRATDSRSFQGFLLTILNIKLHKNKKCNDTNKAENHRALLGLPLYQPNRYFSIIKDIAATINNKTLNKCNVFDIFVLHKKVIIKSKTTIIHFKGSQLIKKKNLG